MLKEKNVDGKKMKFKKMNEFRTGPVATRSKLSGACRIIILCRFVLIVSLFVFVLVLFVCLFIWGGGVDGLVGGFF